MTSMLHIPPDPQHTAHPDTPSPHKHTYPPPQIQIEEATSDESQDPANPEPPSAATLQLSSFSRCSEPYSATTTIFSTVVPGSANAEQTPRALDDETFQDPDKTIPTYDVPPLTPFISALHSHAHAHKNAHVHFAGEAEITHTHHYVVNQDDNSVDAPPPRVSHYIPRRKHHVQTRPTRARPNLSIRLPPERDVLRSGTSAAQKNTLLDRYLHEPHKKLQTTPFTPLKSADAVTVLLPPHVDTHESASQIASPYSPRGTTPKRVVRKKRLRKWTRLLTQRLDALLFPELKVATPWIFYAEVFSIFLGHALLMTLMVCIVMFVAPLREFAQQNPFSVLAFVFFGLFILLLLVIGRRVDGLNIALLMISGVTFGWSLGMIGAWNLPIVLHSIVIVDVVLLLLGGWMILSESILWRWQTLFNIALAFVLVTVIQITSGMLLAFTSKAFPYWHVLVAYAPIALVMMYVAGFSSRLVFNYGDNQVLKAASVVYVVVK